MYYAGTSCIDITPPVGYLLQGHSARSQPSESIHDPLRLKVLTVSDGRERAAIVTSDLVYFVPAQVAEIKDEISRRAGLPPERVMLTAAHTHTGPFMFSSLPKDERVQPDYLAQLRKKIVGSILEAIHREEPATLRWGGTQTDIGVINRRRKDADGRMQMAPNPDRPIDPEVSLLAVCNAAGRPLAVLGNYTCHPTVIATNIYQISADYPGYFQHALERMYPGIMAMFTNGCCGDVRPAIINPETGMFGSGTFADAERMGNILAGAAVQAFEQSEELPSGAIAGRHRFLDLPLDKELLPGSADRLRKAYEKHQDSLTSHDGSSLDKWRDYWRESLDAGQPVPSVVPAEIQALHLGPARIAGIAGETMVEIGLRIKEGARRKKQKLMLCGDANGVIGYLPTAAALPEGGYETNSFIHKMYAAPYSPDMEDCLVNAVLDLL